MTASLSIWVRWTILAVGSFLLFEAFLSTRIDEEIDRKICHTRTATEPGFLIYLFRVRPYPTTDQLSMRDRCLALLQDGIATSSGGIFIREWYLEMANHEVNKSRIENMAKGKSLSIIEEQALRKKLNSKMLAEAQFFCHIWVRQNGWVNSQLFKTQPPSEAEYKEGCRTI